MSKWYISFKDKRKKCGRPLTDIVKKMNNSGRHFNYCLYIVEKSFDAIFLDISHTKAAARRHRSFYIWSFLFLLILLGYGYTFVNYDGTIAFMVITSAFGTVQVKKNPLPTLASGY